MVKSLYTGVSGLKTHQQKMDVIGNNIANVNTTGYKTNVVTFSDIYYQTKRSPSGPTASLGGVNPTQVGYGVQMNSTTPNMSQSGFTFSDSIYDMALDGEGFFQLMDGAGNLMYTRAGIFNIDEMGYLVNADGYHVLGTTGKTDGQPAGSEIIRITLPDTEAKCSSATKKIAGTDVTISVSAPSDNTDMSVTFTHSDYPYATFANGILNIFFDMEKQYESDDDFEAEIADAIAAGGVTLPDDVELKFEFAVVPDDPDAKIATNKMSGWKAETTMPAGESVYRDPTTGEVTGIMGFKAAKAKEEGDKPITVNIAYTKGAADVAVVTGYDVGSDGTIAWTIAVNEHVTASDINDAIKDYIEENPDCEKISCTKFLMPSDATERDAAQSAITAVQLDAGEVSVSMDIAATVEGAYANDYKITFAYSATYGNTKAVWDENNLTITVCNDTTQQDIEEAIKLAAAGDKKKEISITGLEPLLGKKDDSTTPPTITTDPTTVLSAADREAFFGANPAISLGGGKDSFFTEVAKSLTTFSLIDGRTGSPQSYKDLENITVQNDGTIIGYHAVHGYMTLGRVDIATFDNPNGLSAVGGTMFMETVASGEAKLAIAGQAGAGEIVSGALEMSNVDLAQEFTDMITTQRGYQANSRVITTSDTMLEELLNLKR